ncbi:uncharacterized protein EI90DRAFT_3045829 [Cantharellus anzutake]|uniref:uncharacterized protein n=1 Tax=Cantharellus anzutake TaxID=1750568 RepID=UPI001906C282|nr:uncharacterized protein EI90DRAFT_3045829 [Cantharellus anzutake]KAF8336467.1 hypothetical protein EI90DRAFT_3045829 [Cantharellus anzutake]
MGEFDVLIIAGLVAVGIFLLSVGMAFLQVKVEFAILSNAFVLGLWLLIRWWKRGNAQSEEMNQPMRRISHKRTASLRAENRRQGSRQLSRISGHESQDPRLGDRTTPSRLPRTASPLYGPPDYQAHIP